MAQSKECLLGKYEERSRFSAPLMEMSMCNCSAEKMGKEAFWAY